ncbi:hypothetical protein [Streptomyces nogalater]|uniref:Uncharacterized protein n=1 Tax=Streptomyces nogalater TaxID=38314 RepID=A0ABW0WDP6_STRNO
MRYHKPRSILGHDEALDRIADGLMERLTPLIDIADQLAILYDTETLTRVRHDVACYLDPPT